MMFSWCIVVLAVTSGAVHGASIKNNADHPGVAWRRQADADLEYLSPVLSQQLQDLMLKSQSSQAQSRLSGGQDATEPGENGFTSLDGALDNAVLEAYSSNSLGLTLPDVKSGESGPSGAEFPQTVQIGNSDHSGVEAPRPSPSKQEIGKSTRPEQGNPALMTVNDQRELIPPGWGFTLYGNGAGEGGGKGGQKPGVSVTYSGVLSAMFDADAVNRQQTSFNPNLLAPPMVNRISVPKYNPNVINQAVSFQPGEIGPVGSSSSGGQASSGAASTATFNPDALNAQLMSMNRGPPAGNPMFSYSVPFASFNPDAVNSLHATLSNGYPGSSGTTSRGRRAAEGGSVPAEQEDSPVPNQESPSSATLQAQSPGVSLFQPSFLLPPGVSGASLGDSTYQGYNADKVNSGQYRFDPDALMRSWLTNKQPASLYSPSNQAGPSLITSSFDPNKINSMLDPWQSLDPVFSQHVTAGSESHPQATEGSGPMMSFNPDSFNTAPSGFFPDAFIHPLLSGNGAANTGAADHGGSSTVNGTPDPQVTAHSVSHQNPTAVVVSKESATFGVPEVGNYSSSSKTTGNTTTPNSSSEAVTSNSSSVAAKADVSNSVKKEAGLEEKKEEQTVNIGPEAQGTSQQNPFGFIPGLAGGSSGQDFGAASFDPNTFNGMLAGFGMAVPYSNNPLATFQNGGNPAFPMFQSSPTSRPSSSGVAATNQSSTSTSQSGSGVTQQETSWGGMYSPYQIPSFLSRG